MPTLPRPGLATLVTALMATAAQAQPPALPLHEAATRALAHHPSVIAADAGVRAARHGVAEAGATRWPGLRLEASALRFQEPMVVAPLHGFDPLAPPLFDETLVQVSLGVSYTLFDGGRRGALVRREEAGVDLREADAQATQQDVVAEVAMAWLAVAAGRELLAAEDRQLEALRGEAERVRQLLSVGRAPPVEELRVAAALAQAHASRVSRATDVERQARTLARLTGLPDEVVHTADITPVRPASALPEASEAHAMVRDGSPERSRAVARERAAEAAAGAAASAWWPELRLQAGYTDYSSGQGRLTGEWQAGIRAGYTLFAGGGRRAATGRAAGEQASAMAQVAAIELRLAEAADQVLARARAASARSEALTSAVRQHEEVTRIERLALDAGAGTQTDWLAAEAALLAARAALIEARHAEVLARIELARLAGRLTPDALRTLVEAAP